MWAVVQTYSKRSQKKENSLIALTLRHFLLQPGRSLCSRNPRWGLTPSQLHCAIIKVHHNCAAPWPRLSEKSAWCKHCEKGNPCLRRNSGGQMTSILPAAGLVFPFSLHSPVKIHQQLLQVPVAGGQWEAAPRVQPVAQHWIGICASLTLFSLLLGVKGTCSTYNRIKQRLKSPLLCFLPSLKVKLV